MFDSWSLNCGKKTLAIGLISVDKCG